MIPVPMRPGLVTHLHASHRRNMPIPLATTPASYPTLLLCLVRASPLLAWLCIASTGTMSITKDQAVQACYDKTVVHDEKERGRLLEFVDRLPAEEPAPILRADTANEAIVEYLRAKMAGG